MHEAYAKGALVLLPALDDYEAMHAAKVVAFPFGVPPLERVSHLMLVIHTTS